jgi:hypothetical protein
MSTQIEAIREVFTQALSALTDEELTTLTMAPFVELQQSGAVSAAA